MNFVHIVADDMRWDLLDVMPETLAMGTRFTNGFLENPVCCASRASCLTGLYSRSTTIYGNSPPFGGWPMYRDAGMEAREVSVLFRDAGYRTALMGKYLNEYDEVDIPHVPEGWTDFFGISKGGGGYYNVQFSDNGTEYTTSPGVYLTDFLADRAVNFIEDVGNQPFVLWVTPVAPHAFFVPAPQDAEAFSDLPPHRPPSFNEPNVHDKPRWYANRPLMDETRIAKTDHDRLQMFRTVLSLDRLVGRVVQAIKDAGKDDDTMIVFTSDNGYMWGEHRLQGKAVPYVEATRMPMVIRWPGRLSAANDALVQNVDIAPTFADLAGVGGQFDGKSFLPQLMGRADMRNMVLVEHHKGDTPGWMTAQRKYNQYTLHSSGEEEYYRLTNDPFQLHNRFAEEVGKNSLLKRAQEFVQAELAKGKPPGWPEEVTT